MWSLGVTAFVLLTGFPPFAGGSDKETCNLIRKGEYFFPHKLFSEEAHAFVKGLLTVDPRKRLDASSALDHPWLAKEASSTEKVPSLDDTILLGMRRLVRCNALKRAVLSALAPKANAERVSLWADQFEALDTDGSGRVSVKILTERLREEFSEEEAGAISKELLAFDDDQNDETISYASFLASCFASNDNIADTGALSDLYTQLPQDEEGKVSISDVGKAFGDVIDVKELCADLDRPESYRMSEEEFRYHMLRPRAPGLRQLLRKCGSTSANDGLVPGLSRVASSGDKARARLMEGEVTDAPGLYTVHEKALVEISPEEASAAQGSELEGGRVDVLEVRHIDEQAWVWGRIASPAGWIRLRNIETGARLASPLVADELMDAKRRENAEFRMWHFLKATAESDQDGEDSVWEPETNFVWEPKQDIKDLLPSGGDLASEWVVATAEAKDGNVEAKRRENAFFRKLGMEAMAVSHPPHPPADGPIAKGS